ncbi:MULTISPECIES: TonB-dependent siderophore receptor [unclassified Rhodanobacter]|uniref:TonB-dependent receptor plug domain-containing protein n=1 Tax=unclassified Rhodanobacter TaxID=2621553 RepID=UPI001914440E|nr:MULTISPECIES: TonB-dependent receptor [unclassified Rhodanobacter]
MLACLLPVAGTAFAATPAEVATDLTPVTVTATLSAHDTRKAPASVTIVDRAELEKVNPQNLLEAVRTVPGVTLSPRQVGGRKTISLRGMEGRHVLTMVDGRRIVATDDVVGHSDYQYGWLPMSAVERIEVIRGPMSTLYGSEALGGVINLITRKPTDHWEGELGLHGAATEANGGHRAGAMSVYAAGPLSHWASLRVSGYNAITPAVADPDDTRYTELEGGRVHAGTVGTTLKLGERQSLELNHFQGLEKRNYDDVSSAGVGYENRYDIRRRQTDIAWRGDFGDWRGQLRAYDGKTDITNNRTHGVAPTRPQTLEDKVVDGHAVVEWGQRQQLTIGGEARREALQNAGLKNGHDEATHKALFVQDEAALGERFALTTGLRYDHHELFGHELSPRAYLVWEATPELVVKGGYGHAFKAPTLKQISPTYVGAEGPHSFLGNGNIKPETLDSFELSVDWQHDGVNLYATAFRSDVHDLITYRLLQVIGPRRIYQYDNVDKARISGVEAGFGWDISPAWSWQGNLTALDTEDRITGKELEYRPKTSLASHVDWTGQSGWSARLGVQRTGTQYSASGELPAYALWNASVGKSLGAHCELRLALENLGNVRLAEKSPLFGYAERRRTVSVDLRVSF